MNNRGFTTTIETMPRVNFFISSKDTLYITMHIFMSPVFLFSTVDPRERERREREERRKQRMEDDGKLDKDQEKELDVSILHM